MTAEQRSAYLVLATGGTILEIIAHLSGMFIGVLIFAFFAVFCVGLFLHKPFTAIFSIVLMIVVISTFVVVVVLGSYQSDKYGWSSLIPDMSHYWTCMDGCYEAQIVYEQEFNITRSQARHNVCCERCWTLLIENGGDYSKAGGKG